MGFEKRSVTMVAGRRKARGTWLQGYGVARSCCPLDSKSWSRFWKNFWQRHEEICSAVMKYHVQFLSRYPCICVCVLMKHSLSGGVSSGLCRQIRTPGIWPHATGLPGGAGQASAFPVLSSLCRKIPIFFATHR